MHIDLLRPTLTAALASSLMLLPIAAKAAEQTPAQQAASLTSAPITTATITPPVARPGELVRIDVVAERATKVTGRLFDRSPQFFEVSPGAWRAYVAVPVTVAPGKAELTVTVQRPGKKKRTIRASARIAERTFTEHTLRVAKKFTSPSAENKRRMREDREAFRRAYEVQPGPPLFTANFLNPREGAALNSRFGERRVFNGKLQSRHMGLDLDGRNGDPILAANDGVVTMVRDCFGSGNTVVVSHGAGLFTGYFHLSEFKVAPGDQVKRGQLIGLVGSTGRVTGPHLHLAAKAGGLNFDPESLLSFDFVGAPAIASELEATAAEAGQ